MLPKCSMKRQRLQDIILFFCFFSFLIKNNFGKLRRVGFEISPFTYTARASVIHQGPVGTPSHDMNCSSPKDEAWHAVFVTWVIGICVCVSVNRLPTLNPLRVSQEGELQLSRVTVSSFQPFEP